MNNTLTGLGLALVLALVAALVGPWFVDWNAYRADFASQASALVGAPVTVSGEVDARLLPSPYVRFRDVTGGGEGGRLQVAEVEITLAVGALLRGEVKAERVKIVRPRLDLTVAADGRFRAPFSATGSGGADADRISFDRAEIVDGTVAIDAPAGRVALRRIDGVAEAGSLRGPYKFEGQAGADAGRLTLKLATGRADAAGIVRLKLGVTAESRPETFDLDGALKVAARPSFDGEAVLTRPQPKPEGKPDERKTADAMAAPTPWRLAARVAAAPGRVAFEDLDAVYGPDERSVRLGGRAEIDLGAAPRFQIALSGRQIDLDRMAGAGRPATPGAILSALATRFSAAAHPPMPGRLAFDIGSVVLAGDVAQGVRAVLSASDGAWRVQQAAVQLPAGTAVAASGAVVFADSGPGFAGHVDFTTPEFGAFRRWLDGGAAASRSALRRVAVKGDVRARLGALAIENATLSADGAAASGRLAWTAAEDGRRARIDAALDADALDLDELGVDRLLADAARDGGGADVALTLDAKNLTLLGLAFEGVGVEGALDADGFDLKRLSVRDVGGASLSGAGRITAGAAGPEGRLAFDVDAKALGALSVLARAAGLSDQAVAAVERRASALAPAKLAVDVAADADGRRIDLRGQAAGGSLEARLTAARFALDAPADISLSVASADGRRLMALAGVSLSPSGPASGGALRLTLRGAPATGMTGEGRFAAFGLDVTGRGSATYADGTLTATGDVALLSDDLTTVGAALGRIAPGAAAALPATLTARVFVGRDEVMVEALKGQVAGRTLQGRLTVPFDDRRGFDGEVAIDEAPLDAFVALAAPPDARPVGAARGSVWPVARFGLSPARGLSGRLAIRARRVPLWASQRAADAQFTVVFREDSVALEDVSANVAEGKLTGGVTIGRAGDDATLSLRLALAGAQATTLFGSPARASPVSGALDVAIEALGSGRTMAGLVGTLAGAGSATLRGGAVRGLDLGGIDAIEPRIETGLALDAPKIAAELERTLGAADLPLDRAVAPFTIAGGVMRSGALSNDEGPVRLGGAIALDLDRLILDADVTLAPRRPDAPQIGVSFEGPLAAPRRRIDAAALTNWLSVRAVERETRRIEAMEAELQERARLSRERALEEERRRSEERRRLEETRLVAEEARRRAEEDRSRRESENRARLAPSAPWGAEDLPPALDIAPPSLSPDRPRPEAPFELSPARPSFDRPPRAAPPFRGILAPG